MATRTAFGGKDLKIAVVGSVNLDLVARVARFPLPGETVTDAVLNRYPGGKGANQALAARRLGAQVALHACVGADPAADEALQTLSHEGVKLDHCCKLSDVPTGLAMILVDAQGENQIVVAAGANAAFTPDLLELEDCDAVIAQLEVPMETILQVAQNCDGLFCLNAAPAKPVPGALLERTDVLVVNEVEAEALGKKLAEFQGWLAITHGGQGAVLRKNQLEVARAKPPRVEVVDTTGAGDAFTAALSVAMAAGRPPADALQFACCAGALTTTRPGAQSSPLLSEFAAYLEN